MAGLLLLAALPAIFMEVPRQFGDWLAACDNTGRCFGTSLPHNDSGMTGSERDILLDITLTREAALDAETTLSLTAAPSPQDKENKSGLDILVDGKAIDARLQWQNGVLVLNEKHSRRLLRRMKQGQRLSLARSGVLVAGLKVGPVRKILKFFEEARSALRRSAVADGSSWTDLNEVLIPSGSRLPPATLTDAQLKFWKGADRCASHSSNGTARVPQAKFHRLDDLSTLIMIQSRCPGYNQQSLVFIKHLSGIIRPAVFAHDPFSSVGDLVVHLPGARWSVERRRLIGWSKSRAIGDCGEYAEYAWDGDSFELTSYQIMPVCKGSFNLIPLYSRSVRELAPAAPPAIMTRNQMPA